MSSLVDEGTVRQNAVQHSWKKQLSCSCSVNERPIKKSEPMFICIALVHIYVCLGCVWGGGVGGGYGWGDLTLGNVALLYVRAMSCSKVRNSQITPVIKL